MSTAAVSATAAAASQRLCQRTSRELCTAAHLSVAIAVPRELESKPCRIAARRGSARISYCGVNGTTERWGLFASATHQKAALSTARTRQAVRVSGLASVFDTAKPSRRLPGVDPAQMYDKQPSYKIWTVICSMRYVIMFCAHYQRIHHQPHKVVITI